MQLLREPTHKPNIWVPSLLYLGVLAVGLYFAAAGLCGPAGNAPSLLFFVGALGFLLALEQAAERLRWAATARGAAALLALRMLVFTAVVASDCSQVSRSLFVIVPFVAYLRFGRRVGVALAVGCLAVFVVLLSSAVPGWHLNREAVSDLLMFCIGLLFALSTAGIASDAEAQRARAEDLLADLEQSHQQLQRYAAQAAELAAADERNRLARDIHDSLGHYLSAISIQLEKALVFWQPKPDEAEQALRDARRAVRYALQDVRQSVSALRNADESFALGPALAALADTAQDGRPRVELQIRGAEQGFPKLVLLSLYRAAQEGVTNVRLHARAHRVKLEVRLGEHEATLLVEDDGCGFEPALLAELPRQRQAHFGLQGMRERLELVEGRLQIESAPDQGTRLWVSIPRRPLTLREPLMAHDAEAR